MLDIHLMNNIKWIAFSILTMGISKHGKFWHKKYGQNVGKFFGKRYFLTTSVKFGTICQSCPAGLASSIFLWAFWSRHRTFIAGISILGEVT